MTDQRRKRPTDANQLAKMITDIATGAIDDAPELNGKDPAAIARGKLGGAIGGKVRASRMTPEARSEAASKAVKARWEKSQS